MKEMIQELEDVLHGDYELGDIFKEKIVPHAIGWFTGELTHYYDDERLNEEYEDYSDSEEEGRGGFRVGEELDITDIERFSFINTYVATNEGLYSDNGSFNSLSPLLQEVDLGELRGDGDTVNAIMTNNSNKTVIGISSGSYGVLEDDILSQNDQSALDSIHKILFVDDDIWLFGQDSFKIPSIEYPIRLTTGVPL